jgi:ABC-type Fe3+-hydroxamate transport system substrate-binding protein
MIFIDHLGNTIELTDTPKRIISLVPSQTELLWDLGLHNEIVGITKFCIHPKEMFKSKNRVGGTKTIDIDKIRNLKPDLIIGNKEENEHSQIIELQKEFNVWMSDIYNLNDAYKMINDIGELVNKKNESLLLISTIKKSFSLIKKHNKSVLYLIWKNPFMAAGKSTFIGDLLNEIDLDNSLENKDLRYPKLLLEDIKQLNPDVILLSSEPFPFNEKHIAELQKTVPNTTIQLVDGELFSWYGSRLLKSAEYFNQLTL